MRELSMCKLLTTRIKIKNQKYLWKKQHYTGIINKLYFLLLLMFDGNLQHFKNSFLTFMLFNSPTTFKLGHKVTIRLFVKKIIKIPLLLN